MCENEYLGVIEEKKKIFSWIFYVMESNDKKIHLSGIATQTQTCEKFHKLNQHHINSKNCKFSLKIGLFGHEIAGTMRRTELWEVHKKSIPLLVLCNYNHKHKNNILDPW
jgi:hypothetical protein